MDNIIINTVIGIMMFAIYIVISFAVNIYLIRLGGIKLPIPKKYKDKKSPIYQLTHTGCDDYYSIVKWELGYGDMNENYLLLVLGSGLFRRYGYNYAGTKGYYHKDDLHSIISLRKTYEAIVTIETEANAKPTKIINSLNEEFNKNFK